MNTSKKRKTAASSTESDEVGQFARFQLPAQPSNDHCGTADGASHVEDSHTLVSLDFGTSYTGSAIKRPGAEESIKFVDGYPYDKRNNGQASDTIPSQMWWNKVSRTWEFGWPVSRRLAYTQDQIHGSMDYFLGQFKLLLDGTKATEKIRRTLQRKIKKLKQVGAIRNTDDIFDLYMANLLTFVRGKESVRNCSNFLFVLSAPSGWSVKSYHRWYNAYVRAIRVVWPDLYGSSKPKVFTISEPAAAASYFLRRNHQSILNGQVPLTIDGGGGTIEGNAFVKDATGWEECCRSSAVTSGGNSLNEALRKLVTARLKRYAPYLADHKHGCTIESIVESDVIQSFEGDIKRSLNLVDGKYPADCWFKIARLKKSCEVKGFDEGRIKLSHEDWSEVFDESLKGLETVLKEQHDRVKDSGKYISHICYVGQFCDSDVLRKKAKEITDKWDVVPDTIHYKGLSPIAVAGGAIEGYLDRNNPPTRFLRASFAVERTIPRPWGPNDLFKSREEIKWEDEIAHIAWRYARYEMGRDGEFWCFNTLVWFANAGDYFNARTEITYESSHLFPVNDLDQPWTASEQIWYSSEREKENWYKASHKNNRRDAAILGTIEIDMSKLKAHRGRLKQRGMGAARCYVVELDMSVQMLEGFRHELRITSTWSSEYDDDENGVITETMASTDLNVAAAFKVTAV